MNILLIGENGQVSRELKQTLANQGQVIVRGSQQLDLAKPEQIRQQVRELRPDLIVNAAAYTAVDKAEQDAEAAFRANAEAPGVLARWCAAASVPFVHYSTDYVFDGEGAAPYREDQPTAPLGVYGTSKRDGEDRVRAADGRYLIFRTAWVYAAHGNNFLRTMLRIGAERDALRVVADQIGTPTPAALIADVTARALQHAGGLSGTWHLTASGQTSWHGFAEAIFAEALARGVLPKVPSVEAIASSEYPTPAKRPSWSVLDNSKLQQDFEILLPDWQEGLKRVIGELTP